MTTTNRCEWSDLPSVACAHCQGDDRTITPGDARRWQDEPLGVRVWPPREPVRETRDTRTFPAASGDDSRTTVAQHLRAILDMAAMLGDRAHDLADDPDIPGGDAMVNLASVANLEAWENLQGSTERLQRAYTSVADEDPDEAWPPFQRLNFWSEDWRRQLGMDYLARPTITSEARFLANPDVIAWAWDTETRWDEFVDEAAKARAALENIVRDGVRELRSRIICDRCTDGRRLIRKWAKGDRPDVWKCPGCKYEFTDDEANRALAKQMRSVGAERWVERVEAIGALRVQGWQERVIRGWLTEETEPVETVCEPGSRRVLVWWPSLWRKHLVATQARGSRQKGA